MLDTVVTSFAILVVLGVVALGAAALGLQSVRERYRGRTASLSGPAVDEPIDEDDPADPVVR
jgi:hypothetical protein